VEYGFTKKTPGRLEGKRGDNLQKWLTIQEKKGIFYGVLVERWTKKARAPIPILIPH